MYKTLPNEDESQKQGRLQKEVRESGLKFSIKPLIETNPYINLEAIKVAVETSTAIEGVKVNLDKPKISERIEIAFKQRGRPRKGN